MCGIAGFAFTPNSSPPDLVERLDCMRGALAHRGPDDSGLFVSPQRHVALANRRLAIRDLSPAAHMPMSSACGDLWITYNGELYNADELRAELAQRGCTFRTTSDTEVILHGYAVWGEAVVPRLRGMFAFGVLTFGRADAYTLFLARDPLGIKPLYYAARDGVFIFGSECGALLASGLLSREVNPTALATYLTLGSVPAPLTIYRDLRALEAAHTLTVHYGDDRLQVRAPVCYWSLPSAETAHADADLHALLIDSVRRHMVSDVPLGAFLSGGLDSSAIVALMREAFPAAQIRTCSVVFAEKAYDEARYAWQVARAFDTEHIEVLVKPSDVAQDMERILRALDQPSHDGINTYYVSRAARISGLTVALSGLGGDELFGGYPSFHRLGKVWQLMRAATAVPGGQRALNAALSARGPYAPLARLAQRVNGCGPQLSGAYLGLRGLFGAAALQSLLRPDVLHEAHAQFDLLPQLQALAGARASQPWDAASRFELTGYMRHQLLRDSDVMSMAHSLELRVPFVDQTVVEGVLRMPPARRQGRAPKQLLREAVPAIPAVVRERKDKQGFSFPFNEWLAEPLRPQLSALLAQTQRDFAAYLQPRACERVQRAFERGETNWARPWALAALNACTVNVERVNVRPL